MKIDREGLRQLALPGLLAAVMVAAGITLLGVTDRFLKDARGEHERARMARLGVQTKLSQATDEERQVRERLLDYEQLRSRGIIGDERRLDWIDTLRTIRVERGLNDLRYAIEPRRAVDYPDFKASGEVEFLMSRMKIEGSLLHSGDMLHILSDLRQRVAPHVVVRSCELDRIDPGLGPLTPTPKLRGSCVVDFVTIRDRGKTAPQRQ